MKKENPVVEKAISVAREMEAAAEAGKISFTGEGLEPTNPILPKMIDDEGRPYSTKEVDRQVDAFIERQSLGMLTHSLALAMGVDTPTGFTLTQEAIEFHLKSLGYTVKRTDGQFTVTVSVRGGVYTIFGENRQLTGLRAIHFMAVRHDPDNAEFIKRRLFNELLAMKNGPTTTAPENQVH